MIIEMDKAYMDAHLFRAAVTGNVRVLDEAENSEVAYLFTRSPHQNNILHIAAQHGQVKFIEQALKRFPTEFIHEKNLDEDTPLHVAAEYGSAESVKLLITHLESQMSMISESGSENTNTLGVVYYMVKNKQGDTPFHVALRHASFEAAVELFDAVVTHHPEILSTVNHLGETPLHLYVRCCAGQRRAKISKNRWICEGVLNSKGIYGFRDKKSGTIMFKMLSRLVSAYVFAACLLDNEGLTPVLRAAKTGNLRDVLYLLNSCPQAADVCDASGSTVLHLVKAHPDDYMELKKLIDLPEINILKDKQDCDGNTAGHIAVEHRDYAKIRLLSESLADFTITNNRGLSVGVLIHQQPHDFLRNMEIEMRKYRISTEMHIKLHWEAMTGNVESFAYWRYNADKYFLSRTMEGSSILHVAIENGHLAYVEDALKHYPSLILTRDFRGNTPLHIAARFDNLAAKQVVRDCKCYVELVSEHLGLPIEVTPWETKNSLGHTPLHEALRTNNIEIALELMKLKDRWQSCYMDDSESPLHKLARYAPNTVDKVQTLEQLIQENNWAMFHRDSEGLTPLLRAAQCGRFLLALLILQFNPQSMDSRDWGGRNFLHHLRLVKADVEEKEAAGWLCSYIFKIPQMLDILSLTQDHNGNTPLHQTILDGEFDVALLMMIEWSVKMEPKLILAIRNNEGKCVMDLILTGLQVPVNLKELVKQAAAGNILEEKIYDASSKGDESLFQLQRPTYAKDSDNEEIKHANDDGRPSSTSDSETPEASNRGHNDDNNIDDKCLMCQTRDGSNIIHIAIQHGQTSFMERALAIFPNLIFQKDLNGDTPLHIAARLRNAAALKCLELACRNWLYKAKEDSVQRASLPPWMIKNSRGNTLFHEAARTSNYQAVSIVMEYATIEAFSNVNENGETVLHLLARYGTYDAVDKLEELAAFVRHGCSFAVYIRDFDGLTPFIRAVKCGRMRLASFIRQYHPQSAQIRGYKGRTPLHHLELSPVDLVDDSEDIGEYCTLAFGDSLIEHLRTTTDEDGNTPLHLAIMRGNVAVAKFLMGICLKSERRQELTIVNKDGYSILGLLSSQGHIPDMVSKNGLYLASLQAKANGLFRIIPHDSIQLAISSLKKLQESMRLSKRHVKERALLVDKKMDDVIYQAVIKGNVQILEEKLTEESDVENGRVIYKEVDFLRQTPDGSSLLHIALRHGKEEAEEFVDKLLDRFPALVLHTDSDGDTPLHVAAKLHSPLSQKFLGRAIEDHNKAIEGEKRGVYLSPLKVKNSMGNTPIHEALLANNAYAAAIMISIEPGTASNVNDFGETPLHVYARYGLYYSHEDHTEYNIVKDLITQDNSTAFMRDDEGLTPLLRAARCGRFRVTRRILEHCPQSAYLRDPNGRTFLHHLRFTGGDVTEFSADYIFEWMGKKLFEIPEADVQRLVQDADGDTPLHYTIKTRNFIAAEVLTRRSLETGRLEFGRLNNNGETVLDLLASHDAPNEIIKLIRKETSGVMYTTGSTFGIRKAEIKESTSALSVIAGLLATITFAAALQVPGGFDSDDGSPILLRTAAFQIFLISDAIAMCASMIVLFFLLWVMACSKIHDSYILLDLSMTLLQASFYATLLAFMTGVYVATAHKTLWMAIIVCALCSIVILITWRTIILYLVKKIRLLIDIFITVKGFSFKKFKNHMGIYLGINDSP